VGASTPLLEVSRLQWPGIVHTLDGIVGLPLGSVYVQTDILGAASLTGEGAQASVRVVSTIKQGVGADPRAAKIAIKSLRTN